MWAENDSDSDLPHQGRQQRQRRIEIHRQLKRISDEAASEEAARNLRRAVRSKIDLPTEEEVERMRSLEASEQQAAARREQEWEELQNELYEIRRTDRARRTSTARGLNEEDLNGDSDWDQDEAVPESPQQSSALRVSDSGSLSPGPDQPVSPVENGPRDAGPEEVDNLDEDDEANAPENPSSTLPRTRWIAQKDLGELIHQGTKFYKSEVTDAIYHLDHRGEKVWVVDENGDCVIAQDQSLD